MLYFCFVLCFAPPVGLGLRSNDYFIFCFFSAESSPGTEPADHGLFIPPRRVVPVASLPVALLPVLLRHEENRFPYSSPPPRYLFHNSSPSKPRKVLIPEDLLASGVYTVSDA